MKLILATIVMCIVVGGCSNSNSTNNSQAQQAQVAPPPSQASAASYKSLSEAIEGIKPTMSDAINDISPGAVSLALWSTDNMYWNDFQDLEKTKYKLVMKDSDEQRGKGMCATGNIIEIASEKVSTGKYYHGGMYDDSGNIFRYLAVKSTGNLVAGSRATFCGVVIGKQEYSNSLGGTAHAVYLVGMFKLPDNLKAKPKSGTNLQNDKNISKTDLNNQLFALISKDIIAQESGMTEKDSNVRMVKELIDLGADVNSTNSIGETPLIVSARTGHLKSFKLLVRYKVNVNAQDNAGETALSWASSGNDLAMVKLLLASRANVNMKNKNGNTVLDGTEYVNGDNGQYREVRRLLIKAGAK